MRLLFVLPEFGPDVRGGIATFYRHLLPSFVQAGHDVDVCVASWAGPAAPSNQDGVRVFGVTDGSAPIRNNLFEHLALAGLRDQLALAYAAWERCRTKTYDVIETTDWGLLHAPWLSAAGGPPVVVQLHGSVGQVDFHDPLPGTELRGTLARLLEAALLPRADQLQTCGGPNAESWRRLLNREVRHIWPAWRSGRDDSIDDAEAADDAHGVAVGRVQSWKGPDVLCEAIRLLGAGAPSIQWIGADHPHREQPSLSDALRQRYPDVWGVTVRPIGEQSQFQTAALQDRARFAVVPSHWDVFNLAAVEAMAAGKVVICSDGAGASELIRHGVNGFRFAAGNATELAGQLQVVADLDDSDRRRIGVQARGTVTDALDPKKSADLRIAEYERLARTGATRRAHPWCDELFGWENHEAPLAALDRTPIRSLLDYLKRRLLDRAHRSAFGTKGARR